MALIVADRVQETTTTTSTGTYTLAGAKDGFQSFAAVGDGNTTYYACTDGTDYEIGLGTYTASGTTLARTTIIESSNSDTAVSWGSGDKDIFVTLPSSKAIVLDATGTVTKIKSDANHVGGSYVLKCSTTDATATVLTLDGAAAGSSNQIIAASDTAITFDGTVVGLQNGAQAFAGWRVEGLLINDGGTTTLGNSALSVQHNSSGWGLSITADDTNDALAFTVTGEAAHNIRWMANIRTSELTYA